MRLMPTVITGFIAYLLCINVSADALEKWLHFSVDGKAHYGVVDEDNRIHLLEGDVFSSPKKTNRFF